MPKCLLCSSNSTDLLCNKCRENPFRVEELRNLIAKKKDLENLLNLYNPRYSFIKNPNSLLFWNKIFSQRINRKYEEGKFIQRKFDEIVRIISKIMKKKKKLTVLDVGIGLGLLEKEIIKKRGRNISLFGIDISKVAVETAKKEVPGSFQIGSVLKIPFRSKLFEVVICLEVLEHIPPYKVFRALSELKRVIKDDGILIVSVPLNENLEFLHNRGLNLSGHVRIYTPDLIKAELVISGFKVVDEKFFYAFKHFYLIKDLLSKSLCKKRWSYNNILLIVKRAVD